VRRQAAVLHKNLLDGYYDAIHVRAGGSKIKVQGLKGQVNAVSHPDGKVSKIPQYWLEAFQVRGSRASGFRDQLGRKDT
jgi:hypothetical protein